MTVSTRVTNPLFEQWLNTQFLVPLVRPSKKFRVMDPFQSPHFIVADPSIVYPKFSKGATQRKIRKNHEIPLSCLWNVSIPKDWFAQLWWIYLKFWFRVLIGTITDNILLKETNVRQHLFTAASYHGYFSHNGESWWSGAMIRKFGVLEFWVRVDA